MQAKINLESVSGAYRQAFRRLAELSGFDQTVVLKAEAGSILKKWAGETEVATQAFVDRRARLKVTRAWGVSGSSSRGSRKADHAITVNAGVRGVAGRMFILKKDGSGFRRTHEAGFRPLNQHYKPAQWRDLNEVAHGVQADWQKNIPLARRSVGLARQSVVQIADSLGIDLIKVAGQGVSSAGIAKARAAMASNGRSYRNGSSVVGGTDVKPYIDLINSLPYATSPRLGMDTALAGVIAGRTKYFQKSYEKGAFDSFEKTARAFPNIIRVSTAA